MTSAWIRSLRAILPLLIGGLVVFSTAAASAQDAASTQAKNFVESLAENAILSLTDSTLDRSARIRDFRILLEKNFAVDGIGKWVLGKYWRRASAAEKREYLALFEDLIIATYVDRFADYSGTRVFVGEVRNISKNDYLVRSRLDQNRGQASVNVDWRLRRVDGDTYLITDVMVEGLSMAQTQRSEFYSVVSREGRTVEGLLRVLRERVNALKNPAPS